MEPDAALAALRAATGAMAATVGSADLTAAVPSCPGWDVTTLVDHVGRVHLWAAYCARHGEQPHPYPRRDREVPLSEWYAACAAELVTTLEGLPADHPAWSFSDEPGHQSAGFWRRRQLHETTIHHVDALQAVGAVPTEGLVGAVAGVSAAQAADGVAEVFEVMAPRSLVRRRDEVPERVVPATRAVAFRCVDRGDDGGSWTLALRGGRVVTTPGVAPDAVATVSGPATHLYLALWHRADPGLLEVSGDVEAGRALLAASLVP